MATNKEWTTACPDWKDRIINKKSLLPCKPLNQDVADIALKVFDSLILVDVIGEPTMGEVTLDWARDFVACIFGSYDPETKTRLITEFLLLIAKKNAKSTLAAGIMMTALILNERKSADLVILAPTKEVANNSFLPIRDMIKADEELASIFHVQEHTKTVTHRGTNAKLKVIAAESDALAGVKASYILVDELWLFGKRAGASSMLREATGGLASRPEGFVIYLTTMPDEPPAGVMKQKLDYARDVRDGKLDDKHFLGLLYEYPKEYLDNGLHLNQENWYITNPNMGASVNEKYIEREFKKAESEGKEELQDFLAKHLNVQIGMSLRANRWAASEFWEDAKSEIEFTLEDLIAESEVITIGIDGGGLDDLLGLAVMGRLPTVTRKYEDSDKQTIEVKPWWVWTHAWCHEIALERRKTIADRLKDFQSDGDLTITKNLGEETTELAEICRKVHESGKLYQIGLDPLGIGALLDEIISVGIPEDKLVGVPQGFRMSGYIKTCENKIARGDIVHTNQPLLAWSVGNCRTVVKGSGTMLSKAESGTAKIDPVIAMLNATALMSSNPDVPNARRGSVFFV